MRINFLRNIALSTIKTRQISPKFQNITLTHTYTFYCMHARLFHTITQNILPRIIYKTSVRKVLHKNTVNS